jgi:hypothetical protein
MHLSVSDQREMGINELEFVYNWLIKVKKEETEGPAEK